MVGMLTQDEAELYDRQIRLWGVGAQSKIRQSRVLMLGFNGVASEVAKILVLAGIDSLTIVDDQTLQDSDIYSNLFCRPPANGQRTHDVVAKLKKLNPLVKVNIDNSPILSKEPKDYKGYDLVTLHSFMPIGDISKINLICRSNKVKFYLVLDYGFYGFMFNDLGSEFSVTIESAKSSNDDVIFENDSSEADEESDRPAKRRRLHSPSKETESKIEPLPYVTFDEMISLKNTSFDRQTSPVLIISIAMMRFFSEKGYLPKQDDEEDTKGLNQILDSLKETLNLDEKVFKRLDSDWNENIYSSLSPVCAVVGGVAGQDMIRALSNKDIPIYNTFSFDGIAMSGIVERLGISESRCLKAQPIVTDFLQIDDDED